MDSREEFEDLVCKVTNARNFTIREEDGEYASERVQDMFLIWEAACAQSVQGAKPVAWMNPSNPHEVISYKKKNEINRCYNLGIGKSAERYSVPLYTQPEGDGWIKCSERLPTEADVDCDGCLWVCWYDNGWRMDREFIKSIDCEYFAWKPTGLKLPRPPQESA